MIVLLSSAAETTGEANLLQQQRESIYTTGLSFYDYLLRYFVRIVIPILSIILFLDSGRKKNWIINSFAVASLFYCIAIAFGSGSRMFVAHLILVCLIVIVSYRKIRSDLLIISILSVISLLTAQTIALSRFFSAGVQDPVGIATIAIVRLFERVFLTKGVVTSYVFDYFPK